MTKISISKRSDIFINSKGEVLYEFQISELEPSTTKEKIEEDIEEGKKLLKEQLGYKNVDYWLRLSKEALKHKLWET